MLCYICNNSTPVNAMDDLDEREFDKVVEEHMLIACHGTDEQFDADGNVIVCAGCVADALEESAPIGQWVHPVDSGDKEDDWR